MLNVFGGLTLNEFARVGTEWRMCRSEYVLDHHFSAPMPSLGDAMGELQLGTGLDSTHPLFRKLYTSPLRLRRLGLVAGFASLGYILRPRFGYCDRSGIPFSRQMLREPSTYRPVRLAIHGDDHYD